jgi:deoxyribodipyrimidine photo-lyase
MTKRVIFWFRKGLRVEDNTGLYHAAKESKEVIPVFIFNDDILKRPFLDNQRVGFLLDAIQNLDKKLKALGSYLLILKGKPEEIIANFRHKHKIDVVYLNKAYSFEGIRRDKVIENLCLKNNVAFNSFEDTLLVPPHRIEKRKVFTPLFYKI